MIFSNRGDSMTTYWLRTVRQTVGRRSDGCRTSSIGDWTVKLKIFFSVLIHVSFEYIYIPLVVFLLYETKNSVVVIILSQQSVMWSLAKGYIERRNACKVNA